MYRIKINTESQPKTDISMSISVHAVHLVDDPLHLVNILFHLHIKVMTSVMQSVLQGTKAPLTFRSAEAGERPAEAA